MQNINLLDALPLPKKWFLRTNFLIYIICGWIIILLAIYGANFMLTSALNKKLNKLNTAKYTLTKNIAQLNNELAMRAPKFNYQPRDQQNFSYYLTGLAHTVPQGIWLTEITLSNVDNDIVLHGNSLSAILIPKFLHNLQINKVFTGKQFSTLEITKNANQNNNNHISFSLMTRANLL